MSVPLEVFCCYAREDREMLEHLKKHLMPLQRNGQITVWSDTNLNAGVEWEEELHRHLESADIILLLVSPDFMASDYCYSTEMRRAIERHDQGNAHVIPILLRPTFWQSAPFAKLQMLPTNATPVTNWLDRDKAFHDITEQVYRVISELQKWRAPDKAGKQALQKTPVANVGSRNSISPFIAKPDAIEVLFTYTGSVRGVALSADGLILASGGSDDRIKLWDIQKGELLRTLTGSTNNSQSIALSGDGRTLASGSGYSIRLWNAQTGQPIRTLDNARFIESIVLSGDGRTLASSSWSDPTIKLWDIQTGRISHTLTHYKDPISGDVKGLALSIDGRTLASGGWDNTIKLWDTQKGKLLHTLVDQKDKIGESIALSADGRTLATVHDDDGKKYGFRASTIKLWTIQKGKLVHTTTGFAFVPKIVLSADGLLACGHIGGILLWDIQAGHIIRTLPDPPGNLESIALSANGLLLACSSDKAIEVWGEKE